MAAFFGMNVMEMPILYFFVVSVAKQKPKFTSWSNLPWILCDHWSLLILDYEFSAQIFKIVSKTTKLRLYCSKHTIQLLEIAWLLAIDGIEPFGSRNRRKNALHGAEIRQFLLFRSKT